MIRMKTLLAAVALGAMTLSGGAFAQEKGTWAC